MSVRPSHGNTRAMPWMKRHSRLFPPCLHTMRMARRTRRNTATSITAPIRARVRHGTSSSAATTCPRAGPGRAFSRSSRPASASGSIFSRRGKRGEPEAARPAQLQFVSVEKHPFAREGLSALHARYPEFEPLAGKLQAAWPLLLPGLHRLRIRGRRRRPDARFCRRRGCGAEDAAGGRRDVPGRVRTSSQSRHVVARHDEGARAAGASGDDARQLHDGAQRP